MARIFRGGTSLAVWTQVCSALDAGLEIDNAILEIGDPTSIDDHWAIDHNPGDFKPAVIRSTNDVANTIFPERLYRRARNRLDLYQTYLRVYNRGKQFRRNRGTWGTYFLRMISFGDRQVNRLEQIIVALLTWRTHVRTPFVMHLTSPETDNLRTISGPCLQYIQFIRRPDNTLAMVALVRNHDYFEKALGNLIGLGHLLGYVCSETDLAPGELVCHSVHAYNSASKKALRDLVA